MEILQKENEALLRQLEQRHIPPKPSDVITFPSVVAATSAVDATVIHTPEIGGNNLTRQLDDAASTKAKSIVPGTSKRNTSGAFQALPIQTTGMIPKAEPTLVSMVEELTDLRPETIRKCVEQFKLYRIAQGTQAFGSQINIDLRSALGNRFNITADSILTLEDQKILDYLNEYNVTTVVKEVLELNSITHRNKNVTVESNNKYSLQ